MQLPLLLRKGNTLQSSIFQFQYELQPLDALQLKPMEYPGRAEPLRTNTSIIDFEKEFDDLSDAYDAIQKHNESDEELPEAAERNLQEFGKKLIPIRKAYVNVIRFVVYKE